MKFDEDIKNMNICFQAKLQRQRLRDNTRKEQARRNIFNNRSELQNEVDTPEINFEASELQNEVDTPEINFEASELKNGVDTPEINLFSYSKKTGARYGEKIVSKPAKSKYEFSLFSMAFSEDSPVKKQPVMVGAEEKIMHLLETGAIPFTASGGVLISDIVDAVKADNVEGYRVSQEVVRLILKRCGWKSARAPRSDFSGSQPRVWYPPFNNFQ